MEEAIINFVAENEFIYNKKHKNHKNYCLRNKKFKELAHQLNMPMDKVKNRWRTLRDTFCKEMKYENRRSDDISTRKTWKWLDLMMFINDVEHTSKRKSKTLKKVIHKKQKDTNCYCFDQNFKYNIKIEPTNDSELEATNQNSTNDLNVNIIDETSYNLLGSEISNSGTLSESAVSTQMNELFLSANREFIVPEQEKSYVRLFFDSITQQVEKACISGQDFCKMQIEILEVVNEILYKN